MGSLQRQNVIENNFPKMGIDKPAFIMYRKHTEAFINKSILFSYTTDLSSSRICIHPMLPFDENISKMK